MTIQQLQAIDVTKVKSDGLKSAIEQILIDYDEFSNKKLFEDTAKDNIEKVFQMVEKTSPEAIPQKVQPEKKEVKKNEASPKKKFTKEETKKELEIINNDIKACRAKIRAFNKEKRENEPEKPKPKRHEKIKRHFISITNLIPPALKDDIDVLKLAERILLKAHRDIMNAYRMNTLRTSEGEKEIKEKYDQLEEKATKDE